MSGAHAPALATPIGFHSANRACAACRQVSCAERPRHDRPFVVTLSINRTCTSASAKFAVPHVRVLPPVAGLRREVPVRAWPSVPEPPLVQCVSPVICSQVAVIQREQLLPCPTRSPLYVQCVTMPETAQLRRCFQSWLRPAHSRDDLLEA